MKLAYPVMSVLLGCAGCSDDTAASNRAPSDAGVDVDVDADAGESDGVADAGCACNYQTSSFGTDAAALACLCPLIAPLSCIDTFEAAITPGLLCSDYAVIIGNRSSACSGPLSVTFDHGCLEGATLFYDRTTHALVGAAAFKDNGTACSTGATYAGTTTTENCDRCVLCGEASCEGSLPSCQPDAG